MAAGRPPRRGRDFRLTRGPLVRSPSATEQEADETRQLLMHLVARWMVHAVAGRTRRPRRRRVGDVEGRGRASPFFFYPVTPSKAALASPVPDQEELPGAPEGGNG